MCEWRRGEREYFEVERELSPGFVVSPQLFNIFFDRGVRRGNEGKE